MFGLLPLQPLGVQSSTACSSPDAQCDQLLSMNMGAPVGSKEAKWVLELEIRTAAI
jgi:hypothetical protein